MSFDGSQDGQTSVLELARRAQRAATLEATRLAQRVEELERRLAREVARGDRLTAACRAALESMPDTDAGKQARRQIIGTLTSHGKRPRRA